MLTQCCKFSHLVYHPQVFQNKKHIRIQSPSKANTCGIIVRDEDRAIVTFKGSNSMTDLMEAAKIVPTRTDHGTVHSGFFQQYRILKESVLEEVGKLKDIQHVYFTGHSMGGCIAMLCALDSTISHKYCYLFGSPAFCDEEMNQYTLSKLDDLLYVDVSTDLVAIVPLNPNFSKPTHKTLTLASQIYNPFISHSCATYYDKLSQLPLKDRYPEDRLL